MNKYALKRLFPFSFIVILLVVLVACGGEEKTETKDINANDLVGNWKIIKVEGEIDFIDIEDNEVMKFRENGEFEWCTDSYYERDCSSGEWKLNMRKVELILDHESLVIKLKELSGSELTGVMTYEDSDVSQTGKIKFRRVNAGEDDEENKYSGDDKGYVDEEGPISSESENWDDLLDAYENYIDQCILLMKDVAKGDELAVAEYMELAEKAAELSMRIDGPSDTELSEDQKNRYLNISAKLATAATDMH